MWFAKAITMLFDLYPGTFAGTTQIDSWWRFLRDLPEQAIKLGFRRAVASSLERCPSAPLIRAHAQSVARLGGIPAQNLETPALPEPELKLPSDNPFHDTLERYKRGEVPGKGEGKAAVSEIVKGLAGEVGESESHEKDA